MLVIPAVDILDGKVVRLEQGDERRSKVYGEDPLELVKTFFANGASLVHVVDLNAAIHGNNEANRLVITKLLHGFSSKIGVQIAGGIKNILDAHSLLELGARRIVIGSLAYSDEEAALSILKAFGPSKSVLALDYDEIGKVRTKGWKKTEKENVESAVVRFSNLGFKTFLLTAIERDGMLTGPDFVTLSRIRKLKTEIRIIASGGLSSDEDLEALSKVSDEAIVGKAIYEGKISAFQIKERN